MARLRWIRQVPARFLLAVPAWRFVETLQALLVGESPYTDEVPVGGKAAFGGRNLDV